MKRKQRGRGPKSRAAGEGQQGKVHNDVDDGIGFVIVFNLRREGFMWRQAIGGGKPPFV
jgi:hypothetical protein